MRDLIPLGHSLRAQGPREAAVVLPSLSPQERGALVDLDFWSKDDLALETFAFWPAAYGEVSDDKVKLEFFGGETFALFFKASCKISPFDQQDPVYPPHDHFFLTDDSLLLVEYDGPLNLQGIVRQLYALWGVEAAYAHLVKVANDSFFLMREAEYEKKKQRLRDFGFVDYYEALEWACSFSTQKDLDRFVRKKKLARAPGPRAPSYITMDMGHFALSVKQLEDGEDSQDSKRAQWLRWDFLRANNGALALEDALRSSEVVRRQVAKKTAHLFQLGLDYLQDPRALETYGFTDLYKIGHSFLSLKRRRLARALIQNDFGPPGDQSFLGAFWGELIAGLNDSIPQPPESWEKWEEDLSCLEALLPFARKFYQTWQQVRENLQGHFYLNYSLEEVDLEAILLSSFANAQSPEKKKLGLTVEEFQAMCAQYFDAKGELVEAPKLAHRVREFAARFGLLQVPHFESYFQGLFIRALHGQRVQELSEGELRYVSGPMIFDSPRAHP